MYQCSISPQYDECNVLDKLKYQQPTDAGFSSKEASADFNKAESPTYRENPTITKQIDTKSAVETVNVLGLNRRERRKQKAVLVSKGFDPKDIAKSLEKAIPQPQSAAAVHKQMDDMKR